MILPAVSKKKPETVKVSSSASTTGPARLCEDPAHEHRPGRRKILQTPALRSFPNIPDASVGESIFTEKAKQGIAEICICSQHNVAILLE
jgi:hypothetical protein